MRTKPIQHGGLTDNSTVDPLALGGLRVEIRKGVGNMQRDMTGFTQPAASKNMKVVTGGAGFIGSHIASRLHRSGQATKVIDSLKYGTWQNVLGGLDAKSLVKADLATLSVDEMARELTGCDVLFHFAAEKHNNAINDPQRVIDANITATARLFEAAGQAGVRKVIFASSLYAYGRLAGGAMRETDVAAPSTVYGVAKLAGEGLLREAGHRHGFEHLTLRLFFVYGPRQFAGMGYPSVIVRNFARILQGEPPVIFGDGRQVMDYVFIDDVVAAVMAAANTAISNEVINIGSGQGTSIRLLTETMLSIAGSGLNPVHAEPDWTAGTVRVSDPGKAKKLLGFSAETKLELGLDRVWSWMKQTSK